MNYLAKLLKVIIIDFELASLKAVESVEHLSEYVRENPRSFSAASSQSRSKSYFGLTAARSMKSLASARPKIARTLSTASSSPVSVGIRVSVDIEESGVRCQVNLASFIPLRSDQTHKPLIRLQSNDLHSGTGQCPFDGGSKPVDALNGETEEVEISGTSINIASDDERAPPAKAKSFASSSPATIAAIRS